MTAPQPNHPTTPTAIADELMAGIAAMVELQKQLGPECHGHPVAMGHMMAKRIAQLLYQLAALQEMAEEPFSERLRIKAFADDIVAAYRAAPPGSLRMTDQSLLGIPFDDMPKGFQHLAALLTLMMAPTVIDEDHEAQAKKATYNARLIVCGALVAWIILEEKAVKRTEPA